MIVWMLRSFKERIQETEEAHGLLNNHLQTNVQVKIWLICARDTIASEKHHIFCIAASINFSAQEISDLDEHIAILK